MAYSIKYKITASHRLVILAHNSVQEYFRTIFGRQKHQPMETLALLWKHTELLKGGLKCSFSNCCSCHKHFPLSCTSGAAPVSSNSGVMEAGTASTDSRDFLAAKIPSLAQTSAASPACIPAIIVAARLKKSDNYHSEQTFL